MSVKYNEVHPDFKINGYHFDKAGLCEVAYSFIKEGDFYEKEMGDFTLNWFDDESFIVVKTSGSTGKPKSIKLDKQAMVNSAIASGKHFNLEAGDSALHCLPANYVAGKMMMVRAFVLGLHLDVVTPSSHPFDKLLKDYSFAAFVPLQLKHSVQFLDRIEKVIVGGAPVTNALMDKIQNTTCKIYETYGMTETVTHVATRPINHLEGKKLPNFTPLAEVELSTDDRHCLVINAPHLNVNHMVTNDVVELFEDGSFDLKGRIDSVINTGGIKVHPEQIEKKISGIIPNRYFITDQKDEELGYRVVLVIEAETNVVENSDFSHLEKHEVPRAIYSVPKFIETHTGKINKRDTLELVREKYNIKKRLEE